MNLQEFLQMEIAFMLEKKAELEKEIRDATELLYAIKRAESNKRNKN